MSHRDADSVFNTGFADIDATNQPAALVSHQDRVNSQAAIQASKRRAYAMLEPRPGDRVLEVGCGSGDDVRALARIVGATGLAVGVDVSETMVADARRRSEGLELPGAFKRLTPICWSSPMPPLMPVAPIACSIISMTPAERCANWGAAGRPRGDQ